MSTVPSIRDRKRLRILQYLLACHRGKNMSVSAINVYG